MSVAIRRNIMRLLLATALLVAVPAVDPLAHAAGAPVTTTTGTVTVSRARGMVPLSCNGPVDWSCRLSVRLSVMDGTRRVFLGRRSATLPAGRHTKADISLNAAGRALLARRRSLRVQYTVRLTTLTAPNTPVVPPEPSSPSPSPPLSPSPSTLTPPSCPPFKRPVGTAGTGIYGDIVVAGGPLFWTCAEQGGGEVQVLNGSGSVVASTTVAKGETFNLAVEPGTYRVALAPYSSCEGPPVTVISGQETLVEITCNLP